MLYRRLFNIPNWNKKSPDSDQPLIALSCQYLSFTECCNIRLIIKYLLKIIKEFWEFGFLDRTSCLRRTDQMLI